MPEQLKEILSRVREIRAKGEKLASQATDLSLETTKLLSRLKGISHSSVEADAEVKKEDVIAEGPR